MPVTKSLHFSWYELMANDVPKALAFYRQVFGWNTADAGGPPGSYTLIKVADQAIGGALALTPDMCAAGARPGWIGYIGVPDVAAKLAELVAAGGKVLRPVQEIPGMIRFAVVADPQGAAFVLYRGLVEGVTMPVLPQAAISGVGWHELHAGHGGEAWEFYSKLFGWTKDMAVDMGAVGTYQTWAAGGAALGGMMTKMPQTPAPFWLFYVNVDSAEAAIERVKRGGGSLIHGPTQVPGGSWIANCLDPEGAIFALVSQRK